MYVKHELKLLLEYLRKQTVAKFLTLYFFCFLQVYILKAEDNNYIKNFLDMQKVATNFYDTHLTTN